LSTSQTSFPKKENEIHSLFMTETPPQKSKRKFECEHDIVFPNGSHYCGCPKHNGCSSCHANPEVDICYFCKKEIPIGSTHNILKIHAPGDYCKRTNPEVWRERLMAFLKTWYVTRFARDNKDIQELEDFFSSELSHLDDSWKERVRGVLKELQEKKKILVWDSEIKSYNAGKNIGSLRGNIGRLRGIVLAQCLLEEILKQNQ